MGRRIELLPADKLALQNPHHKLLNRYVEKLAKYKGVRY
jgi:hypothetical protein